MNKVKNVNKMLLTLLLVSTIVLPTLSQTGKAPVVIDSAKAKDYYLEMKATIKRYTGAAEVTEEKLPVLPGATISVYDGMNLIMKVETNEKGRCVFRLPLERTYKIQVSKNGYVTKFFVVNTIVPKLNLGAFTFNFDLDIFEEIKNLDVKALKKPIAKVTFDPVYTRFQYDESYTSRVNFELKKMYKNYYEIQKATEDSIAKYKKGNITPIDKEENKKGTPPKK